MKIKASKLVALLLAVVLVFGAVAVAASAAESDPYVKISSVVNAVVGAKNQTMTVSLSPATKLTNAKLTLSGDTDKIDVVGFEANPEVTGIKVDRTSGTFVINVTSAENSSLTDELVLATITFNFDDGVKGAVALSAEAGLVSAKDADGNDLEAKINDQTWGKAGFVVGEEGEVYTNMVGIGLKGFIKSAGKAAPAVNAKAVITLKGLDGKEYEVELDVSAFHGNNVMTKAEFAEFVEKNKTALTKKIQTATKDTELTYDDFDLDADSVKLNGAEIDVTEMYDKDAGAYVYTAVMNQCEPTKAYIKVVFRAAFENKDLYHSSNISDYIIEIPVHAGKAIMSQAAVISYIKEHVDLYNQRKGDLDTDNDGRDDLSIDDVYLNQHIIDASAGQYDLGDFVLDESVAAFNNGKISGSEKYEFDPEPESIDKAKNVYTVYFDQINVPQSVLMAAAEAFGSIDYGQFADANVVAINEAIGAFQAFCDSLVNAEWPEAEDVEESEEDEEKDNSDSPKTGSIIGLGSALAVVAALSATAVAIVRKKED